MAADHPVTPAIRALRAGGVAFTPHVFAWVEKGGTRHSSQALGVPEHQVIKTLVFEDEQRRPLIVLMHGDREVSAKALARHLGVKKVAPCSPETAERHTGYQVGGLSPFGLRRPLPIHLQRTIADLPRIWINGGGRGFLVELDPRELVRLLAPAPVEVAQPLGG
jgi:Cys-tRNA(Pro) deacylase